MTTFVLGVLSTKGGNSKSTLATCLAVRAAKDGPAVLLDCDPQASSVMWWQQRGEPGNPDVFYSADPVADIESQRDITAVVILDGPPSNQGRIRPLVRASSFVLIPVRVSAFDIDAIRAIVEHCEALDKPFAFILTHVTKQWERLTATAIEALKVVGGNNSVMSAQMHYRMAYAAAVSTGKTGPELSGQGDTRDEIDAIWQEILRRAKPARGRR